LFSLKRKKSDDELLLMKALERYKARVDYWGFHEFENWQKWPFEYTAEVKNWNV
jgi:hypothetical protein